MKTIYIDAGHGGSDPGAFSAPFAEKELNLKAALACRDFLGAYDCQVIMSRTTDVNPTVTSRYKKAIAETVDAVLCMHHNAGGGDGGEVWFWHTDASAKQLAALVAQEYKAIGQNLRTGAGLPEGTKASMPGIQQNFGMCREPSAKGIPAILGEFAFVDNATDRLIVDTDAELVAQGQAYGKAVVKFLGLQLKGNTKPPEVPVVTPTKSIEEIAREVISGKWGNGNERIQRLTAAGYDPFAVQAAVNKMITEDKPTIAPPIVPVPEYVTVAPFQVKTPEVLNIRKTPNGQDIGDTVTTEIYTVSKTANDAQGRQWYFIGEGWIAAWYCVKYTPPVVVPQRQSYAKGAAISLINTPIYLTSTSPSYIRRRTGTFYIYDGVQVNGRYRITNTPARVGKTPMAFNVTGWIKKQ